MAVPKIYHPYRKQIMKHLIASTVVGFVAAEAFWRMNVIPRVERRNLVMTLLEKERRMKADALDLASQQFPRQGSYDDLVPDAAEE